MIPKASTGGRATGTSFKGVFQYLNHDKRRDGDDTHRDTSERVEWTAKGVSVMNEADRAEAAYLRSLPSDEAATFLLDKYANAYPVTVRCRSWKVADQFRLARKFLQGRAHASQRPYEDFLSFMSLDNFLKVIAEGMNDIPKERIDLLKYYLIPALRRAVTDDAQRERVQAFIDEECT